MDADNIKWIEHQHIGGEKSKLPHTFFSLQAQEQLDYNAFRQEHTTLKMALLPALSVEREVQERREQEKRTLADKFKQLVSPYFERQSIELSDCFLTFGEEKEVYLGSIGYTLFEDDYSKVGYAVKCNFFTSTTQLHCSSRFDYFSTIAKMDYDYRQEVLKDIIIKLLEQSNKPDDEEKVILLPGSFIYFAPTDYASRFLTFVEFMLKKIGKDQFKELVLLNEESAYESGEYERSKLRKKVLQEAYERKLEQVLLRAGLKEQELRLVERK